jgi:hypothetical protein
MSENDFLPKKENYSSPSKGEEKVFEKKSISSDIKKDFKHVSELSRHVSKLNSPDKKKFAEKYGISYKDESEIRGKAKSLFLL